MKYTCVENLLSDPSNYKPSWKNIQKFLKTYQNFSGLKFYWKKTFKYMYFWDISSTLHRCLQENIHRVCDFNKGAKLLKFLFTRTSARDCFCWEISKFFKTFVFKNTSCWLLLYPTQLALCLKLILNSGTRYEACPRLIIETPEWIIRIFWCVYRLLWTYLTPFMVLLFYCCWL